jgi:hypothetical protein
MMNARRASIGQIETAGKKTWELPHEMITTLYQPEHFAMRIGLAGGSVAIEGLCIFLNRGNRGYVGGRKIMGWRNRVVMASGH